jgi:hypothetical protein
VGRFDPCPPLTRRQRAMIDPFNHQAAMSSFPAMGDAHFADLIRYLAAVDYGIVNRIPHRDDRLECFTFRITDPDTIRALECATGNSDGGFVRPPCPWGADFERVTATTRGYGFSDDFRKALRESGRHCESEAKSDKLPTDVEPRHVIDKRRINKILQTMAHRVAADIAVPEEWMDELCELLWRERDRLKGDKD